MYSCRSGCKLYEYNIEVGVCDIIKRRRENVEEGSVEESTYTTVYMSGAGRRAAGPTILAGKKSPIPQSTAADTWP